MKIYNKILKIISLSLLLPMIISGCSIDTKSRRMNSKRSGEKVTFYAACDSGYDTITAMFMRDFAKRVKEKSQGKIEIETYSDSQVGSDVELLESCQNGNISFVFQTTAPQVSLIPEVSILDLPMAFKDLDSARKALDTDVVRILKPYYKEKNIELLGFSDQGFREMTSNKKITKLEDFHSVKIRTMENPYHILFWKSIGANPTPMAYSEVYIGLQQGAIDAQENPLESIIAPRFYEQQDYLIMTNHLLHSITAIASKEAMDTLKNEDRKIIYDSIEESKFWSREQVDKRFSEKIDVIKKSGTKIIYLDEKILDEMKLKSKIVLDKVENNIGKDIVEKFINSLENK